MTTFVLGAGASKDADYPLATEMGGRLYRWMTEHEEFVRTADFLKQRFGHIDNVESLLTAIDEVIATPSGSPEETWVQVRDGKSYLECAVCEWFRELRKKRSKSYELFATKILAPGDFVLSFNYDVSLDFEMRMAGLLRLGDGYGFEIEVYSRTVLL